MSVDSLLNPSYLHKVFHITGKMKKHLPLMLGLNFLALGLELIGLALIIPYLTILRNPEKLTKIPYWTEFAQLWHIETHFQELLALSLIIFVVFLLKTLLNIQVQRMILDFSYDLQSYLKGRFSHLFISAPYLYHTQKRSGEILNLMQSHINQFSRTIVGGILRIVGESITLASVFVYLILAYPIPTITAFVVLTLFGVLYDLVLRKRLRQAGDDLVVANNEMVRDIREGILSVKEARVLGCGEYFHRQIKKSCLKSSTINASVAVLQMVPRYILELLVVSVVILSALFMLLTGDNGMSVIDGLAVFAVAAVRLLPSANQIVTNLSGLRSTERILNELYTDMQELEARPFITQHGHDAAPFQSLKLENITFSYPSAPQNKVLDGITLEMKKGEIIGLVGPSGAGKSTLVNIILGLVEPDQGKFYLNHKTVSPKDWAGHQYAAYIPQKPVMLDGSIIRNIALGQDEADISPERMAYALEKSQMATLVKTLPQGADSMVGEDAVLLSGGQRQRLATARAFYFARDILIFDEATSALDHETEKEVLEAIQALKNDAAILLIAHGPQALQICDRVCYLSQGKLEER